MAYTAAKDENLKPARSTGSSNSAEQILDQDGLTVMAHRAGQKLSSVLGSAYNEASHAADVVTTEIRKKPVQSAVIALGVGYVLAAIFRR